MSLLTFLITFFALAAQAERSPGLPGLKNLDAKVEFYQANINDSEASLISLISDFENAYNTNAINNRKLNQTIFCILYDFYLDSDRSMAFFLRENAPHFRCEND